MPLNATDRASLLSLMTELGPQGDRSLFIQQVHAFGSVALDEIGQLPGVDQLRCGLLRVLDQILDADELDAGLQAAEHALGTYPGMATAEDPMLSLARHPAWVGLAQLELSEHRRGSTPADWDRAVSLASAGFRHLGTAGRGEVLWAMAEQAESVAWTHRATSVLEQALDAPFDEESHRGEVRLLLGLRYAEDEDPRAVERLTEVATGVGPAQRKVHARWVLSALVREEAPQEALGHLTEALVLLESDPDAPHEVTDRVRSQLAALGAPDVDLA